MGSKKLKAIAVRGTKPIELYNKERVSQVTKEITKRSFTDLKGGLILNSLKRVLFSLIAL